MEVVNIVLLALLIIFGCGESANILVAIPFTVKSHYIFLRPIGLELARRGHNVTVITAFRETDPPPNYHEVMVFRKELWDFIDTKHGERTNVFDLTDISPEQFHKTCLWKLGIGFTEHVLKSPEVQRLLHKDLMFDIVIAEQFYTEAMYILAHKYQAPLILVTAFGNCMRHNILLKNPLQQATVASEFIPVESPTSFWGRVWNWYFTLYEFVHFKYWYIREHDRLVKEYVPNLPDPVPSLYDIEKNASITLYNSHFSFDSPIAYLPNIIEVGGLHLTKSDGTIPEDLRRILDDATHGVVYVNFGSHVRSIELPEIKRDAFIKVFRKLRQTVLWKWEDDTLENLPNNLVIRKWFPQEEILSHPNIKVFISHGGLMGTQEAIFHGVPLMGMPVYGDQFNNLRKIEEHGFGKLLQYKDINENNLENMLQELLTNASYGMKAKELSRRFKDRPMAALDTTMFWIEYVLRNKGADFIKNPARKLHWIESSMLDVYAVVVILPIVILIVMLKAIRVLVDTVFSYRDKTNMARKKKN